MSLKYQPINARIQAVIDVLKKEHPGSAIETLSYDFESYDLILEHDRAVYIVGIKLTRATMQTVFKLVLYGKTVAQRYASQKVYLKLYAPSMAADAKAAFEKAGGSFQKLASTRRGASDPVKVTSPGSWKVACYFLKNEATVNQASVSTGVSYPWTRSVVKKLVELGALMESDRKVALGDIDALFKAVAWERPINSLKGLGFQSAFEDEPEALKELYANIEGIVPKSACTLFTAADLYLEGTASGGCIQLYADENAARVVKSLMGEGKGVSFQIYNPDRDLDADTYEIGDIRVVSIEQAILDLAGLGSAGADAAKVLVQKYRSTS
ncbi:MAG TPA: hypothetical protein VMC84_02490 [Methanocella sp.]|uniref:hypothetical protein n=1 Tax=Methanocella sp. TaxID=2052833 RepID=UPI002C91A39B|nr:hypothetical protein [Methanocella sp.]HTY90022.1 hypothetical protein [Methanocella sp.]